MYKILIRDEKNKSYYKFLTVRQEITEVQQVPDALGNLVDTIVGTGNFETVPYTTDDRDELEAKCVELFSLYNKVQFIPVDDLDYDIDLIFS